MQGGDFFQSYGRALRRYLSDGEEASLAVGHELGRRALKEKVSLLEIIEEHSRVVEQQPASPTAALPFLLQTLATFDVATGGYLDGAERYAQQRARADDLADRDAFRTALVNSLQEGFFVVERDGTVTEVNEAFANITGCGADGLPYRWPYPWLVDEQVAAQRLRQLVAEGTLQSETPIQHRNGRITWAAVSMNAVTSDGDDRGAYVGTIRDITAARAAEARRSAVVRFATDIGVATSVTEVLDILLDECRAIDVTRIVVVRWTRAGAEPIVQATDRSTAWRDLDAALQVAFDGARQWPPLSVEPVGVSEASPLSTGMMTVLSGADDTALWLEYAQPRLTSYEDRLLVAALVGHLSLAVQHVRQFEAAREASLTLQRAMMPTTRPPVGFAVRYEPAVSPLEVGGDWYDVLVIGDDRIGIIVGDCVGSGLGAAAVMGQLRSSARALLVNGAEPARLIEELDSAAMVIPGAYFTTVFVGTLNTATGDLTYSSAGHPPALLAAPDAAIEMLTEASAVPLAVQHPITRPQASTRLRPGATLMLYTDGLVERRGLVIDDGIRRAGDILVDTLGCSAEDVADAMLGSQTPPGGFDDDVAIVVYRRPPTALRLEVVATPDQLADIRARLADWLRAVSIPEELAADITLVVNEACTNSIEHGYRGRPAGPMSVSAEVNGREICIEITDSGSWKTPDPNPRVRGRGVPLMRAVSGGMSVDGTAAGTTVTMSFPFD
ncbi:MAG TPA: SpoIIE family protein phosphatase [Mycobacterium sp.]|nr:SpoIIE family protein phosphatase [Mycobacterium sp.]